MFLRLLLLFTIIPLVELFLLIRIGQEVGSLATVALVILTGALGAWLAKSQGIKTLRVIQSEWTQGKIPTDALVDGLLILIAGAVLLTPGLLTDLFGFSLLVPAGRRAVRGAALRLFRRRAKTVDAEVIVIDDFKRL